MELPQLSFDKKIWYLQKYANELIDGIKNSNKSELEKKEDIDYFDTFFKRAIQKLDVLKHEKMYWSGIDGCITTQLKKEGKYPMELQIKNDREVKALSSVEVAQMVEKPHKDLLRTIRQYCDYLAESKIALGDFFVESTYKDSNNQDRPCYLITKKGCDMVANKLTGKKGTLFTAKYVTRFEEMEHQAVKPLSAMELLALQYEAVKEVDARVEDVNEDLQSFKKEMPLLNIDCDELQKKVRKIAIEVLGGYRSPAYNDQSIRQKIFEDIQRQIKREFDVNSYKAIKRSQLAIAIDILDNYKAPMVLKSQVTYINSQERLEAQA